MIVQGPDIDELQKYANALLAKVKEIDGVNDADTSFEATQPELRIDIDRQRAADLGVSMDTLSSTMSTLVGGQEVS
jgi:multidrug efflux pump subunit AcrB